MVEFRTPSAVPKLKPDRIASRNPRKGQILTSSSSPSSLDRPGIRPESMNRNPDEDISHAKFDSPFPPSIPPSRKPAPAGGLSRPRFVKVRKHSASARAKATVVPDNGAVSGFNPFRSVSDSGWIDSEAETRVSESSTGVNSSSSGSVDPKSTSFTFGAAFVSNSKSNDIGPGDIPVATANFGREGMGKPKMGAFVCGCDSNIGCFGPVMSESTEANSDTETKNAMKSAFQSTTEGGRNSAQGAFVFVGSVMNSCNLGGSSSFASGDVSFSHQVDEMRSSKFQSIGSEDGCDKIKPADRRCKVDENKFVFGGSMDVRSEGSGSSDVGVFVVGSVAQKSSNLCRKSSLGHKSRKVKLQIGVTEDGYEKTQQFDSRSKVEESNFIFGGSKNASSDGSRNSDAGLFVFGSGANNSYSLTQNSSPGYDKGSFSQLPDQMRKLNLQTAGNEDGLHNTNQDDCTPKADKDDSYFVVSNNLPCSSGVTATNKLPDETKLNAGKTTLHTAKDGSKIFAACVFTFGSDSKASCSSSQTSVASFTSLNKSITSELLHDITNSNNYSFKSTKENDCTHKVDESPDYVFGSCNNVFVPSEGTEEEKLPYNLNYAGKKAKNSVGNSPDIQPDGLASVPFKFSFQAGKEGHSSSTGAVPKPQIHDHITPGSVTTPSSHPTSFIPCFQTFGTDFTFTSTHEGLGTPHMEFRSQKQEASCFPKENMFTTPHRNVTSAMKKRGSKGTRMVNRRSNTRGKSGQEKASRDNTELESPDDCSPMDYSPYKENVIADLSSREASVASEDSIRLASRSPSTDSHVPVSLKGRKEGIFSVAYQLEISNCNLQHRELDENGPKIHGERNSVAERSSGFWNESLGRKYVNIDLDSDSRTTATGTENNSLRSKIEMEASQGEMLFTSTSSLKYHGKSNYTFAAPHSVRGPRLPPRRRYRSKKAARTGQDPYSSMPNTKVPSASSPKLFPVASNLGHLDPGQGLNGCQTGNSNRKGDDNKSEASQESISAAGVATQEACEKWRFRGNQAYANGHLSKAEKYYTCGVNSLSSNGTSRSCIQAVMLCYSNRAAARMSLGRMREAINDCEMALAIDPSFLKAQVRAANCHLRLGNPKDALKYFEKCLQPGNNVNSDRKLLMEASEGLKKVQQVADWIDQSVELLLKGTMNDATKALEIVCQALSICPFSECLMEMKAEALLMLRSYEDVIRLCEQTLDSTKINSIVISADSEFEDANSSECKRNSSENLWRQRLIAKSYFYMGKLEEAIAILQKIEEVKTITDKYVNRLPESSASLSATICELLRLKAAGNKAFQAGKHLEAVEHYTAALACNTESRPFVAICFCNRAAAYQALGQITDAIADCSLAIALDAYYNKAISRRATLHEMIRDYGQAANDLNRLMSLLKKQLKDKGNIPVMLVRSSANSGDLKQVYLRLSTVEEESRQGTPLDMYMILGIDPSSSAADVKKAYRKAALRHHPDKAGYFIARSENVDDGLWKEVASEVHMYADRLFKMIGEAYTVLSDPTKRLEYDAKEEMRSRMKVYSGCSSTPKTPKNNYSGQYERSSYRGHWRDYGSSHYRWSESSYSDW